MKFKIPLKDLNHSLYPLHSTNIYNCEVTFMLRVRGSQTLHILFLFHFLLHLILKSPNFYFSFINIVAMKIIPFKK